MQTLLLMRQFLEDAERESEKEIGADGSELNVKDTRSDSREPGQCVKSPKQGSDEGIENAI